MFVIVNFGEILTHSASICVIIASMYGLWRFAKRNWNSPNQSNK